MLDSSADLIAAFLPCSPRTKSRKNDGLALVVAGKYQKSKAKK